jgi:DNA-binding transcriptional ArsR family regulator
VNLLVDWDDEIHRALAHPIRRRIIECLQKNDLSFRELVKRAVTANHGKLGFHLRVLLHAGKPFVEHDPSTKKYRLTERGQLVGELIWSFRFMIDRDVRDLVYDPARYAQRLRFGDHAALFYETEDAKRRICFPFLKVGLLMGEAVVYVPPEDKLTSETREILNYGIHRDHIRSGAFTIMSDYEWFMKRGKAQPKKIIDNWRMLVEEKQKAGFSGVRGAVEMELLLSYSREQLLRLETTLGRQFALNLCGLCLYKTRRLDEKQFIEQVKSHGHSIFKGIGIKRT